MRHVVLKQHVTSQQLQRLVISRLDHESGLESLLLEAVELEKLQDWHLLFEAIATTRARTFCRLYFTDVSFPLGLASSWQRMLENNKTLEHLSLLRCDIDLYTHGAGISALNSGKNCTLRFLRMPNHTDLWQGLAANINCIEHLEITGFAWFLPDQTAIASALSSNTTLRSLYMFGMKFDPLSILQFAEHNTTLDSLAFGTTSPPGAAMDKCMAQMLSPNPTLRNLTYGWTLGPEVGAIMARNIRDQSVRNNRCYDAMIALIGCKVARSSPVLSVVDKHMVRQIARLIWGSRRNAKWNN